ncbi:adenylate kinase [Micromonospora sp. WMMA1949]|uniref:adenylate kinase n=1 Tax=unclassified Micromonospora TaxID=2617518 RepID=UPI0022B7501C|nr:MULTISPECIES: adenylate kinase [unclassified Micromonospora]MCZ7429921.1 adenylate kinase [Micromonospora sp. WMMA1949]WBC08762.1 adenylate kinase [Micromonospora sp. WMMA1947]
MNPPARILVEGVHGSGKSTLAALLAQRFGLPWYPVDDLLWEPGWVEVPVAEQRRRIDAICRRDRWILDGAYHGWRDVVLGRADLVIGLDYPRGVSFRRLLRRTLGRLASGEQICNGNRETLGSVLSRDSVLVWHLTGFGRARRRMRAWAADPAGPSVLLFDDPAALDDWLARGAPVTPRAGPDRSGLRPLT